ncbi:uncharacterized protein [Salminus brasiliensis]|uniref:uncharacterized protein n=1 Tax=Salminus brasiliensis TaxID=930266 RepID=UPI003B83540D
MEGPLNPQKKMKSAGMKKRPQTHSGDIVFTRNGSIQTLPSLAKRLKTTTEPVIGLQYIWEYRSPTKSVPPHYQCKLCKVQRLQNEMAAHITGWKHGFNYIKRSYPDKVPHDEESATKDPAIRKAIKAAAAEVEKEEGRGQVRVVIKEPSDLPAFQNMKSAHPSVGGSGGAGLLGPPPRGLLSGGPFGGGFPDPTFPGEFAPRSGLMSDFSPSMHGGLADNPMRRGQLDMGRLSSSGRYDNSMPGPDRLMGSPENMQRYSNSGHMRMGSDDFGGGLCNEGMGRSHPGDLPMNSDRMMGGGPKGLEPSSTLATLLRYLDTFRIENEDDAQIVLKVTQKLTDVLMEYRLRSISSGPSSGTSSSLGNMSYSSRMSLNDRFSSSMSGPSRYYN